MAFGQLSGSAEYTLDPKGRVIIPVKYREALGSPITIMRGDGCVRLCSQEVWEKALNKYDAVDEDDNPKLYKKMRKKLATSVDGNMPDKQGRLLIPPSLRSFAKLDKEIVVSGAGNYVEVWDREAFYEFVDEDEDL